MIVGTHFLFNIQIDNYVLAWKNRGSLVHNTHVTELYKKHFGRRKSATGQELKRDQAISRAIAAGGGPTDDVTLEQVLHQVCEAADLSSRDKTWRTCCPCG